MIKIDQKAISRKEFINVEFLYTNSKDKFKLKLLSNDSGFSKKIFEQNLHRNEIFTSTLRGKDGGNSA